LFARQRSFPDDSNEEMSMKSRDQRHCPVPVVVTALLAFVGFASVVTAGRGPVPRSAFPGVASLDRIERREMPRVDVAALRAEDAVRERSGVPVAPRVAKGIRTSLTPDNSGTWETLDDGSQLWRLRVSSPGALSLSLGLEKFDVPNGAVFWVHAPDGSGVQGPYTREDRNAYGGLWTAVVLGEELVAELQLPAGRKVDLEITSVNHGYRAFGQRRDTSVAVNRGSCNINVVCPVGYRYSDQIRSVARITFSDGANLYLCTAQLINNTAETDTPYLYSAGHCVRSDSEAATVVAYWNYQTATCDDRTGGSLGQNQSGATLRAHSYRSDEDFRFDFALLELDDAPDASFDVFYAGWDARDLIPDSTTTVHHPGGDQKSISFDFDPPTITSFPGLAGTDDENFLKVGDWDVGTTEGGSSGACLWDEASGLCVGSLTGGFAACGNDEPDWYARFHRQWEGEGTPQSRLSDWLDPFGTGAEYVFGKSPGPKAPSEVWLIPAVASTTGVEGSNWRSQLSVANTSTTSRNALVYFVPEGERWQGRLLSGPHLIGPMGSLYVDDPLLEENPTAGLLYVIVDGDGTAAFSRTIHLEADGSTFGQGVPGILLNDAGTVTELALPMVHSAPGRYRTNLGFAQISGGKCSVLVSIFSSESFLLAEKKWIIDTAWRQIDDIFDKMGIGYQDVEGGWIRVKLASGSPAFWTTYATVIDDSTNDPTYVVPVAP
jgi:hypothetical protein